MKNRCLIALVASALFIVPTTSTFAAESYTLDPAHTSITWIANHFGFSYPSGKFANATGTLTLDEANPQVSKVNVTIPVNNLATGIDKFNAHLLSADFFDAKTYPTATFESTKVEPTGSDTAKVTGNLTVRGITKPVVLDVKLNKIGEHPMSKKKAAGFSAITTVKRSDFGMNFALPGVADDVRLLVEAEGSVQ